MIESIGIDWAEPNGKTRAKPERRAVLVAGVVDAVGAQQAGEISGIAPRLTS